MNEDENLIEKTATEIATPAPDAAPPVDPPPAADPPKSTSLRDSVESALKAVNRARDAATGRFTAEQRAAADAAAQSQPKQQALALAPPKIERPANMPKAWGADKAALWGGLPPEVAAYVQEREAAMEQFHAKHAGLAQWMDTAQANGTSLPEVLERMHAVEVALHQDAPQGLLSALAAIGADRNTAAQALMGALQRLGVNVGQPQPPAQLPPEVRQALARVERLERVHQETAVSKAQAEVTAFFDDPKNEFARDLQNEILEEVRAAKALGKPVVLATCYERALWTRPDIREKLVTKQTAEKEAARVAAEKAALDKSRSAARTVTGSPPLANGRSSATPQTATRSTIAEGVRAAFGRV